MTTQLPSKVRLAQIARFSKSMALPPFHDEIEAMARALLAAHEQEPVAWQWQNHGQWHVTNDEERARDLAWDGVEVLPLYTHPAPVTAVSTRERLATLQLASIINDLGLPENAPFVEITSEIFRLKELESTVHAVPDIDTWRTAFEYSERQRDDGFNLHKCGEVYESYKTQERWESWLSSRAAMLNGGKS